MKPLSAPEKFAKIYQKNPEILFYSGNQVGNLLGVSHTRGRDIKYEFIRKNNIKVPEQKKESYIVPKLEKVSKKEEINLSKEVLLLKKELGAALNFKSTPQYY